MEFLKFDAEACTLCGKCVNFCPAGVREIVGQEYSVKELSRELMKDQMFYEESGGGVTFSGGEPLCQAAALLPLAKEIKKLGLNLFIYTGSIFEDLLKNQNPDVMALLQEGDFLVDGPFVLAQRDLTLLFRGSQNQRILDLPQSLAQGQAVLAPIGQ